MIENKLKLSSVEIFNLWVKHVFVKKKHDADQIKVNLLPGVERSVFWRLKMVSENPPRAGEKYY